MFIVDYLYEVGTEILEDRVSLLEDREGYTTNKYLDKFESWVKDVEGTVAVLYVGGAGLSNSECRDYVGNFQCSVDREEGGLVIKNILAYMLHKYIGVTPFADRVVYANVNANTCASSMYAVYEAEKLLKEGTVDNVLVIAEEKTSFDTIRIFHEHRINVKPGEGFAYAMFSNKGKVEVKESKWGYSYNRNPFYVDSKGYSLVKTNADVVKGHKTGTSQNEVAEAEVFGNTIGYKDKVGHCQGASGLIELCMVLDDNNVQGTVLCVASGLGGFYGSCVVVK
jgi:hypothetical protein